MKIVAIIVPKDAVSQVVPVQNEQSRFIRPRVAVGCLPLETVFHFLKLSLRGLFL